MTARSFGPPALTAEIGSGFATVGGMLVVSEPPGGDPARWPQADLESLGFGPVQIVTAAGRSYAAFRKTAGLASGAPQVDEATGETSRLVTVVPRSTWNTREIPARPKVE